MRSTGYMMRCLAEVTGPDGRIQIGRDDEGRAIVTNLPATLPVLFDAFSILHGAVEAVVAGDERIPSPMDTGGEAGQGAGRRLERRQGRPRRDRDAQLPGLDRAYMAVLKAGGVATLINGWWQAGEMRHALDLAEPELIIADETRAEAAGGGRLHDPTVALPVAGRSPRRWALSAGRGGPPEVSPEDDATILFTSGSTGLAKGAVSTHRAVTTGVYAYAIGLAVLLGIKERGARRRPRPGPWSTCRCSTSPARCRCCSTASSSAGRWC